MNGRFGPFASLPKTAPNFSRCRFQHDIKLALRCQCLQLLQVLGRIVSVGTLDRIQTRCKLYWGFAVAGLNKPIPLVRLPHPIA
jgi:hypothetical protein